MAWSDEKVAEAMKILGVLLKEVSVSNVTVRRAAQLDWENGHEPSVGFELYRNQVFIVTICVPPLPLAQLRDESNPGAPRFSLNGNGFWWRFAVRLLRDDLQSPRDADGNRIEDGPITADEIDKARAKPRKKAKV